jgi:predicted transcriptional regulator
VDLRQSEASIAISNLSSYVTVEERKIGRGRPQKFITMKRKAYVEYIKACVDCFKARYEVARDAGEELMKE